MIYCLIPQLKPPNGTFVFKEPYNPHFSAYHSVDPLWPKFEPFELTHNHRQGEGAKWANALNRIRIGKFTEDDVGLLRPRITSEDKVGKDAFHIMYTNEEVAKYNQKGLDLIEGNEIQLKATRTKNCYIDKKKGTVDSTNFMDVLKFKIGSRVKLVFNINTMDGLVNGAFGNVVGVEKNRQGEIYAIIVRFDQETTGQEQRRVKKHLSDKYKDNFGTPIFKHTLEYFKMSKSGHKSSGRGKVIQFPLWLADASTSHNAQVK